MSTQTPSQDPKHEMQPAAKASLVPAAMGALVGALAMTTLVAIVAAIYFARLKSEEPVAVQPALPPTIEVHVPEQPDPRPALEARLAAQDRTNRELIDKFKEDLKAAAAMTEAERATSAEKFQILSQQLADAAAAQQKMIDDIRAAQPPAGPVATPENPPQTTPPGTTLPEFPSPGQQVEPGGGNKSDSGAEDLVKAAALAALAAWNPALAAALGPLLGITLGVNYEDIQKVTNLVEEMFPGGKFNLPAFEQAVEKHLAQLNDPAKVREAVQKILEHARPAVSPAEQAEIDKAIEKIGQIERVWKELAALSQSDLADPTRLEALLREALVRNRDMNSIVLKHLFADYLRSRGVPAATVDAAIAKL